MVLSAAVLLTYVLMHQATWRTALHEGVADLWQIEPLQRAVWGRLSVPTESAPSEQIGLAMLTSDPARAQHTAKLLNLKPDARWKLAVVPRLLRGDCESVLDGDEQSRVDRLLAETKYRALVWGRLVGSEACLFLRSGAREGRPGSVASVQWRGKLEAADLAGKVEDLLDELMITEGNAYSLGRGSFQSDLGSFRTRLDKQLEAEAFGAAAPLARAAALRTSSEIRLMGVQQEDADAVAQLRRAVAHAQQANRELSSACKGPSCPLHEAHALLLQGEALLLLSAREPGQGTRREEAIATLTRASALFEAQRYLPGFARFSDDALRTLVTLTQAHQAAMSASYLANEDAATSRAADELALWSVELEQADPGIEHQAKVPLSWRALRRARKQAGSRARDASMEAEALARATMDYAASNHRVLLQAEAFQPWADALLFRVQLHFDDPANSVIEPILEQARALLTQPAVANVAVLRAAVGLRYVEALRRLAVSDESRSLPLKREALTQLERQVLTADVARAAPRQHVDGLRQLALLEEDFCVALEQVLKFHDGAAGTLDDVLRALPVIQILGREAHYAEWRDCQSDVARARNIAIEGRTKITARAATQASDSSSENALNDALRTATSVVDQLSKHYQPPTRPSAAGLSVAAR